VCRRLGIPIDVVRVDLDRASGLGIEAEARRARYAVYAARPEPFVALAHHRDDLAESVLLQLFRGTGLRGAAAMPLMRPLNDRVTLYRPLLAYSRAELHARARALGLEWVDDESNERLSHDRNYLRHEVATRLDARFPAWRESLARFASHAAEAQSLLEELAAVDGARQPELALDRALSVPRRANALRAFLAAHGLSMPSDARLEEMARQLYDARDDARVDIQHDGARLTRYRGMARIDAPGTPPVRVAWHGEARIELGSTLGSVDFEPAVGQGVAAARTREGEWYVAPRAGGEKLRLTPGAATRTLKNLLQERGIAPTERERLPLLFHGDRLVWVPGVGIAADYACSAGQAGIKPLWRVAGKAPLC
jgi:tRNA(Ile)-lysidine synthase